jgi:quercetin dioxygenase-like cupin family protein
VDGRILFEKFENGCLHSPGGVTDFGKIEWSEHPKFDGVALKHIIKSAQTGGQFSYHLVRIAPGKKIGFHIHETQLETHEVIAGSGTCVNGGVKIKYLPGVVNIFPIGAEHEISAGGDGLLIFAKFFPPLC